MSKVFLPFARFSIFIIFFWFGLLKVIDASPASPMVLSLLDRTMPFMNSDAFLMYFGIFEMIIGITFLIPRFTRIAIALLVIHMTTTVMPLFLLKSLVWHSTFVPTLEGQYIIKNILFVALAIGIASHLHTRRN